MFDIIDVFTREIVGHHEGLKRLTKEALKALDEAAKNRNTDDLILRTDNGVQFRSREFQTRIRELDIAHENGKYTRKKRSYRGLSRHIKKR